MTSLHLLLPVLALTCLLPAQGNPSLLHPAGELLFVPGSAPFQQCHASTLVALPDGDLLAAFFAGTEERAPDVAIYTARLHAGHWSAPAEVVREPQTPTWNPVLFHTADHRLWLFFKAGPSPSEWSGLRMVSTDEGRTWSTPQLLPAGLLGPARTKPLLLPDGTLLAGTSVEAWNTWAAWIERSTDNAQTFTSIGPLSISPALDQATAPLPPPPPGSPGLSSPPPGPRKTLGLIQPALVSVPATPSTPAHLRLYARTRTLAARIAVSDSFDRGRSWSPIHFLALPSNNSGLDAISLADGRVVLVFNNTTEGRSPLNLAVSRDGEHFQVFATLEDTPGEFSYPAIIQSPDGALEITYTWKRLSIKHVHLALAAVPQPSVDPSPAP